MTQKNISPGIQAPGSIWSQVSPRIVRYWMQFRKGGSTSANPTLQGLIKHASDLDREFGISLQTYTNITLILYLRRRVFLPRALLKKLIFLSDDAINFMDARGHK